MGRSKLPPFPFHTFLVFFFIHWGGLLITCASGAPSQGARQETILFLSLSGAAHGSELIAEQSFKHDKWSVSSGTLRGQGDVEPCVSTLTVQETMFFFPSLVPHTAPSLSQSSHKNMTKWSVSSGTLRGQGDVEPCVSTLTVLETILFLPLAGAAHGAKLIAEQS
jgi:hypothetical protein